VRNRQTKRARKDTIILLRVPNYFEDAATIAKAGSLESTIVTEAFGSVAKDEWALWKPTIKKLQETTKVPTPSSSGWPKRPTNDCRS